MKIIPLSSPRSVEESVRWNTFVVQNFPPVGAFLESYEWGNFKEALHGKVLRFAIKETEGEKSEWVGCFQLEIHSLPLGFSYGYAPRGPVLRKDLWNDESKSAEVFEQVGSYLKANFAHLMFVRFEPAFKDVLPCYTKAPFIHPENYLQPRFNQLVTIAPAEEMLTTFSSDIKHDIRAADRLGITVIAVPELSESQRAAFEHMKSDTGARSGKNIFPTDEYFTHFLKNFRVPSEEDTETGEYLHPQLRFFISSNKEGEPVAINLNLLFGNTLTYLYGASLTGSISKRAPAYLHWKTMEYARDHGFTHYDLGGVDDEQWHGLTYFKRQFGGETLEYVGAVDAVLQPTFYSLYCKAKESKFINWIHRCR